LEKIIIKKFGDIAEGKTNKKENVNSIRENSKDQKKTTLQIEKI
jgi:hypothetical protein